MPSILDALLIGEFSLTITAIMQTLKSKKGIPGSMIPPLSGIVGVALSLLWYAVNGDLRDSSIWLHVDWPNMYRGVVNGVIASVAANTGYVVQKNLPGFNLLPSASELRRAALAEEEDKQNLVVDAVQKGVPPETAKEAIGVDQSDPPPNEQLETLQSKEHE